MSQSTRIEGTRVYCHSCEHGWDRARGGLQCPNCRSDFVEILEEQTRAHEDQAPEIPFSTRPYSPPLHDHNPWNAPDPAEDDITTFQFNTNGGRGTVSFTSRTYTFGGNGTGMDPAQTDIGHNFQTMLGSILGTHNLQRPGHFINGGPLPPPQMHQFGGPRPRQVSPQPDFFQLFFNNTPGATRSPHQISHPFEFLSAILNPANAQHGDTVFSQEAFDRVMSQLMEQNQSSGAPGPASDSAISALKKKGVDQSMLDSDGKAECSICMDNVKLQDEVTVLPCNHWFHHECIVSWLKEHDTCPHCRQSITPHQDSQHRSAPATPVSSMPGSFNFGANTTHVTPSDETDPTRPHTQGRYSSSHHESGANPSERPRGSRSGSFEGGRGVGDWFRNHMSFG